MVDWEVGKKASSSLRGTGLRLMDVPGDVGIPAASLALGERDVGPSARIEVVSADSIVGAEAVRPRDGSGFEGERVAPPGGGTVLVSEGKPLPMAGVIFGELTDRPCEPNDPLNRRRPNPGVLGDLADVV